MLFMLTCSASLRANSDGLEYVAVNPPSHCPYSALNSSCFTKSSGYSLDIICMLHSPRFVSDTLLLIKSAEADSWFTIC